MSEAITQFGSLTESALLPAGDWRVDPSRSRVEFTIRKLGAGTLRGRFEDYSGMLAVRASGTTVGGTVRVASIATGNADRDAHLCADGFFAAGAHPEIRFRARRLAPLDDRGWRIVGDLTIRDQTREVELTATQVDKQDRRRLLVRGKIDRRDFGLTWSRAIEATGAVGTMVGIELDLELHGRGPYGSAEIDDRQR